MLTLTELDSITNRLLRDADSRLRELVAGYPTGGDSVRYRASTDFFAEPGRSGKLFLLSEGAAMLRSGETAVLLFEPGDLIGIPESVGVVTGKITHEMSIAGLSFDLDNFLAYVFASPTTARLWSEYLSSMYALVVRVLASYTYTEQSFNPRVRFFQAGSRILEQGSKGTNAFSLLEGIVSVVVDGVMVGHVEPEEIFGVFAALTGAPRSATVVAVTDCLVLELEQNQFMGLVRNRPTATLRLLEGLSRTIVEMNERIVSLKSSDQEGGLSGKGKVRPV